MMNFENCLQDRYAKKVDAKYIITRNTEDFSEAEVPAISPENFLNDISNQCYNNNLVVEDTEPQRI